MQILLNPNEVSEVVLGYVQAQLGLDDTNTFSVECHDDGTIAVYVNEDIGGEAQPQATETKPAPRRRQRRSNKAEQASGNEASSTPTTTISVEPVTPTEAAPVVDAGDTTPVTTDSPGTEPVAEEPVVETPVDPTPEVATTVAVETPVEAAVTEVVETVAAAVETMVEEEPPRKPTQSLFANLRKPNNG